MVDRENLYNSLTVKQSIGASLTDGQAYTADCWPRVLEMCLCYVIVLTLLTDNGYMFQ